MIKNIGKGTYILQFSQGADWDRDTRRFLQDRSYARFADPLPFEEISTIEGTTRITTL